MFWLMALAIIILVIGKVKLTILLLSVEHDSPLYYSSESLVIHAQNVNSPLKPTVRSEFTSVDSLVKMVISWLSIEVRAKARSFDNILVNRA